MKTLLIEGWETLKVESDDQEQQLIGTERIREGGILNIEFFSIETSSPIENLGSAYLRSSPTTRFTFGEASSALDRAIELGLAALKSTERAKAVIAMKRKFIHESCREECVEVRCELAYTIVKNAKQVYEYTSEEKLVRGKRYKQLALQTLQETTKTSYKYPLYLSIFLLFVRALKWLAAIALIDFSDEQKDVLLELKNQIYNNVSYFHLSFGHDGRAEAAARRVLEQDATNVKALYRRAVANTNLQNYEVAEGDLRLLLEKEHSNVAAKKQMRIIAEKKKELDEKYAQAMKKFLSLS